MSSLPETLRGYLDEPAVADPPRRVWRDWAVVGLASLAAVLEATLRTDADWAGLSTGWQVASVIAFFATLPIALLVRRTRPLLATALAFGATMAFGVAVRLAEDVFGGLYTASVVLLMPYALYRWGSGRQGAVGAAVLIAAWVVGIVADPTTIGEAIGGLIVLMLPAAIGLMVRYRGVAQDRAIAEVRSRQREEIARELHDTVAHHVSAIAVQAQAGRAVAAAEPDRAVEVLAVIEEAASRTLEEMRLMVGTLRAQAELTPQQGIADLVRLAEHVPGLDVAVDVDDQLGTVGPAVGAALYRIAQESLTNVVRHAKGARRVAVRVDGDAETVWLTVTDDGATVAAHRSSAGFGLVGMAERAHLLGGRFEAGPTADGGWRVHTELPRAAVRS